MQWTAIVKAERRLRNMKRAIDGIEGAVNDVDFVDFWEQLLISFHSFYGDLEQGAKTNARSRQWFGGIKNDRRSDEMLQYLFEARNDEQHGLATTVRRSNSHVHVGELGPGVSSLQIAVTPDGTMRMIDQNGNETGRIIGHMPPGLHLLPVKARGRELMPPARHRGQIIALDPLTIAKAAYAYHEDILKEAATHVSGPREEPVPTNPFMM